MSAIIGIYLVLPAVFCVAISVRNVIFGDVV
jgi:hypothetical protein